MKEWIIAYRVWSCSGKGKVRTKRVMFPYQPSIVQAQQFFCQYEYDEILSIKAAR